MKNSLNILGTLKPYKYLYRITEEGSRTLKYVARFEWCVQPPVDLLMQWTVVQLSNGHLGFLTNTANPDCKYLWSDVPPEEQPQFQRNLIDWSRNESCNT